MKSHYYSICNPNETQHNITNVLKGIVIALIRSRLRKINTNFEPSVFQYKADYRVVPEWNTTEYEGTVGKLTSCDRLYTAANKLSFICWLMQTLSMRIDIAFNSLSPYCLDRFRIKSEDFGKFVNHACLWTYLNLFRNDYYFD